MNATSPTDSKLYTFQSRSLTIELTNQIGEVMNISPKETLKPFGGSLPLGSIVYFSPKWKERFRERFNKRFLDGLDEQNNLTEALVSLTFAVARFIQKEMNWTPAKSGTMAIEYVLSTLVLEYPTDIIEIEEYCRTVGNCLKPAYKAINKARLLTAPFAFQEDWDTAFSIEGEKTSKREINEAAKEAYFTIERLVHNVHIGTFRNIINNVFPIFESEAAWRALRGITDQTVRNGVIALLKKRVNQTNDPIVTLTDVKIATEQVLTNQALTCGIPTGVTMDAFFQYLRSVHGERIIKETNRTINLGPMPIESLLQGFHNTYGYVGSARIERVNGAIVITFTLRDTNEDAANEIGIPISLRHKHRETSRSGGRTIATT